MAFATPIPPDDFRKGKAAFAARKEGDWIKLRLIANEINDPTFRKLLHWTDLIRSNAGAPFSDRANFIMENPGWPWQRTLRRLAEKSMDQNIPPAAVISWFERFQPLSNQGRQELGAALLATGNQIRGKGVIRDAWVSDDFSATEERQFLMRYGRLLTKEDHLHRLDRLLWNGDRDQALRMFPFLDSTERVVAQARLQLRHMVPNAQAGLDKVPAARRNEPGLVYEQLRWQRRSELNDTARDTLRTYPLDHVRPSLWWNERSILSRRALAEGYFAEAYHTAKDHALTDGAEFAEAEWLSGWIALRFLEEPTRAARHFENMFNAVKYPISRARGAYWIGRAAEFAGDRASAARWYAVAAEHPTTFYGQLATLRRGAEEKLRLAPNVAPGPDEAMAFESHELVKAVKILAAYRQTGPLRVFLLRVGELKDSIAWQSQAAALAHAHEQYDLAIAISKMAAKSGHVLLTEGYPAVPVPKPPASEIAIVEEPLILAMVRQESAFRTDAVSAAGARGLMQLLPGTARQVAREINVPYSRKRLTLSPSYNLTLGQAYIAKMLHRFGGSYVLALAAYNAGPNRVSEWTRTNRMPRDDLILAIDWIEQIPFAETRNYVQRILESLQVYRKRLDQNPSGATIRNDIMK